MFSPESRRLAALAKKRNTELRRLSPLRQDFLDESGWMGLARQRGIRLPAWGITPTVSKMRTFIHRMGKSQAEYEVQFGKLKDFPEMNPDWPTRAWAGLVLEWIVESNEMPHLLAFPGTKRASNHKA